MLLGIFGSQDVVNLNLSLFRFSRWSKLYGQSWGPPQLSVPVKCASAPRTLSCGRAGVLALRGRREVPPRGPPARSPREVPPCVETCDVQRHVGTPAHILATPPGTWRRHPQCTHSAQAMLGAGPWPRTRVPWGAL